MYTQLYDIPLYNTWAHITKIDEGWSKDTKFYIQDKQGEEFLLRISDIKYHDAKLAEFEIIKHINSLDFKMSEALSFGKCNNEQSIFMLLTWVNGKSLDKEIESLAKEQQYALGIESGKILKQLHALPIHSNHLEKVKSKKEMILQRLQCYESCDYRVLDDEIAIDFIKENIDYIEIESPVYTHGDFHVGNLILTPNQHVGVIDFNRWRYADPYEEFYKMQSFDRELSIPFSKGKIDGYFEGNPPDAFWQALAVYNAYAALYSIVWAIPFGKQDIEGMLRRRDLAFEDYEHFKLLIPKWYTDDSLCQI
ncbi:MAG: phosphotransferase [Cellulosilyticaceae bacterium]